jgi:hypothetical protein
MILLLRVCRQARLGFGIAIALIVTSLECYRLVKCSEKLAYLKCPFPDQPTQEKQQPQQITENNKRSRISFDKAFPNLSDHWVVLMIHEHGVYDTRFLMVLSVGVTSP